MGSRAATRSTWRLAQVKTPWGVGAMLKDQPQVQYRIGEAQANYLAARAFVMATQEALEAELARHPEATVQVPGTSRSLVRAALGAGLRLVAPPGLLLVSDEVEPPRTLAISSYGLY